MTLTPEFAMIDKVHEVKRIRDARGVSMHTAKQMVKHADLTKLIQNSSCYEDLLPVLQELVDMMLPQENQL